ncbi:hypothetical protein ACIBVL_31150 [Streptomyces sp. NPDC049687]|uniref:hypothetical protein n=1 Tax=Streptomyces sp. NPDC049687 TaxID=3365596 RepID=UPI0037AFCDA0
MPTTTTTAGVTAVLRALHDGERALERDLLAAAERHRPDHGVHHVATDLARWSHEHTAGLAEYGRGRGVDLSGQHAFGVLAGLREKTAEALGRRPEPGLLLLHDLRDLQLAAARNSLHWEMLGQAAQALRDEELLALVSSCHPQTLRQMRWTNTMIKEQAPQLLSAV